MNPTGEYVLPELLALVGRELLRTYSRPTPNGMPIRIEPTPSNTPPVMQHAVDRTNIAAKTQMQHLYSLARRRPNGRRCSRLGSSILLSARHGDSKADSAEQSAEREVLVFDSLSEDDAVCAESFPSKRKAASGCAREVQCRGQMIFRVYG